MKTVFSGGMTSKKTPCGLQMCPKDARGRPNILLGKRMLSQQSYYSPYSSARALKEGMELRMVASDTQ